MRRGAFIPARESVTVRAGRGCRGMGRRVAVCCPRLAGAPGKDGVAAALLNRREWAWWAGRPFWAMVQAVSAVARPGWHGRGCAGVARPARVHREGACAGVRGSHGPLPPAGLASTAGLAVSAGCLAAVWGSSFLPGLLSPETARRGRARRAGGGRPAQVIGGCWRCGADGYARAAWGRGLARLG